MEIVVPQVGGGQTDVGLVVTSADPGGGDRGSRPPPPWKITSSMGFYTN